MERDEYIEAIRREAGMMAASAEDGLEADVPSCPGWTVGKLIQHTGQTYEFVTDIVATGARDEEQDVDPLHERHLEMRKQRGADFAQSSELIPWFRDRAARLVEVLDAADPTEPVWTWWTPEQQTSFWQRRMAHETAVHRWDTQSAHGDTQPIENRLAVDGVDEALTVHAPERLSEPGGKGKGETFHFHCTDGDGEWLVRINADGPDVRREHAKGDVAIRGTASDLVLFLWQRLPASAIETRGDAILLDRWFELIPPE
ncbi:MAG: maleylpyruvate isomerase family mycothiol-dependent enzyme [Chloroflexota bacterium]